MGCQLVRQQTVFSIENAQFFQMPTKTAFCENENENENWHQHTRSIVLLIADSILNLEWPKHQIKWLNRAIIPKKNHRIDFIKKNLQYNVEQIQLTQWKEGQRKFVSENNLTFRFNSFETKFKKKLISKY